MPANKSTNKVRVTRLFGGGATVGLTDPKVHMQVKYGIDTRYIKALDTGNGQVSLAIESGGAVVAKAYPHDLTCSTGVADYFGWPDATTDTTFGHSTAYPAPTGVPVAAGNGFTYSGPDGDPVNDAY